ncbi:MAG: formylmethanofuran dehydrogenase subunit B [Planctomycetota bacterium]|nr:formylmethanofuran dehydrogenase subunit B [Planctomycetota bacterium]MDA1214955.1 formylmethanofuran dehydrogenase subunit B [Planctomycetota bacterium]
MTSLPESTESVADVACTVCGCVCDDLTLHLAQGKLVQADRACSLALPWFEELDRHRPPAAKIDGDAIDYAEGIAYAAKVLASSRSPLIYGLSRSSTEGQREAVALAEKLGATIDTTASICHGPSIMAIQTAGESTCSLGEIRQRADLVIFWGVDPQTTHPRHLERYSADPASEFLPRGRTDRTLVVIDTKPTATSDVADVFIQVDKEFDFELIWKLRQSLRNDNAALQDDTIRQLHELMVGCKYGVIFFGLGIAQQSLGHLTVDGLLRLVAELNDHTRFVARRMRIPGDVSGADNVLIWQTGYPFSVNFALGYPRYNPGEFSANEMLERGDVDCALVVGSESLIGFSDAAMQRLAEIPTIVLDYPHATPTWSPTVQFTSAIYGYHTIGTAYRMDDIPIPLRKVTTSEYPTDAEILAAITQAL